MVKSRSVRAWDYVPDLFANRSPKTLKEDVISNEVGFHRSVLTSCAYGKYIVYTVR